MKTYLVTGGCGFIGSNFVRLLLAERPGVRVVCYDLLTYAGNLENLKDVEGNPRFRFVKGDIADVQAVGDLFAQETFDAVVNFAAESHVDRSLLDPGAFVRTNVLGTQVLLSAARQRKTPLFLQVSTDEVYGSLGKTGKFKETTPLAPTSPYSSSKAGADLLALAFHHTFGLPVIVTRCSNNYGPYQFPEKLIPLFISNAMEDKPLPLYGDGKNVRDWIHVEDHCRGILAALERGEPGEVYNFGADSEKQNIQITRLILKELGKPASLIRFVQDRPGHDRRYAIDSTKAHKKLKWKPRVSFEEGIAGTIGWYRDNREWWGRIKNGEYLRYYERMYGGRQISK